MRQLNFEESMAELKSGAAFIELPDERALKFTGSEARTWLQGQITADIRQLSETNPLDFSLASPTGTLAALGRLFDLDSAVLAVGKVAAMQAMLERVKTHVILEDVEAQILNTPVYTVQGADNYVPAFMVHDRTGWGGGDMLFPHESAPLLDRSAYDTVQLEAGIPVFGVDTRAQTIISDFGPVIEAKFVSHNKGCYTGQEILHRIFARGGAKTVWVGLRSPKLVESGEYGKIRVTRSAESPDLGFIAAAFVPRELAVPGTILDLNGVSATVVEMPFR